MFACNWLRKTRNRGRRLVSIGLTLRGQRRASFGDDCAYGLATPACSRPIFLIAHLSDVVPTFGVGARPLAADRALVHRAARRLGHPASIPRAIMSRSPEALAFGARRHFIPASLSLPLCGCLINRSRDCSRSRVPPRFPRRRYADAPAAASFSWPALRYGVLAGSPAPRLHAMCSYRDSLEFGA